MQGSFGALDFGFMPPWVCALSPNSEVGGT